MTAVTQLPLAATSGSLVFFRRRTRRFPIAGPPRRRVACRAVDPESRVTELLLAARDQPLGLAAALAGFILELFLHATGGGGKV